MNSDKRIHVTGCGLLSSVGQGIATFSNALRAGQTAFQRSYLYPQLDFPVISALLQDFDFKQAITKTFVEEKLSAIAYRLVRRYPMTTQTSVISALEAWQDAQLINIPIESSRVGIIVCGQNTTGAYQYQKTCEFNIEPMYLTPKYALHFMDTDQVGVLSELLNIHGPGISLGASSASSQAGVIQGAGWIQQGLVDACLVVGVMADLSPLEIQAFYSMGALGGRSFTDYPVKACRPFDTEHEGFIPGQASACVVLESNSSMERRQIKSQGELCGMSLRLAGNHSSNPSLDTEIQVMQQALKEANLHVEDIDYINTHGSSSKQGDQIESQAIETLLCDHAKNVWVNATKSITGHCLWSAGLVELIATLIQLQQNFVHPNLNLTNPINQALRFVGPSAQDTQLHFSMSNAFGFGGINSSLIVKRGEKA